MRVVMLKFNPKASLWYSRPLRKSFNCRIKFLAAASYSSQEPGWLWTEFSGSITGNSGGGPLWYFAHGKGKRQDFKSHKCLP